MKKFVCGVVVGVLGALSISVIAAGSWDTIDVLRNDITVVVNGENVTADNFLYNDTTYLPLRAVSEALNQTVTYDEATNTAYIGERNSDIVNKYTPADVYTWAFVKEKDGVYYICAPDYVRDLKGGLYVTENTNYYDILENGDETAFRIKDRSWKLTYIDGIPYVLYDTFVDEILPFVEAD